MLGTTEKKTTSLPAGIFVVLSRRINTLKFQLKLNSLLGIETATKEP